MSFLALVLLLAGSVQADTGYPGISVNQVTTSISGQSISPAQVAASTITLSLEGAGSNSSYPEAPLQIYGNTNASLQSIFQNLSNGTNASGDMVITNDLGGNTSFYLDLGINSSKYSQAGMSAEASSSTFITSSDSDLVIWAGINGGLNAGVSETVIIGSSNPVTGNRSAVFSSSTINMIAPVTISSAAFIGVYVSTQATGGAGAAVTATCRVAGTFAVGGGCSCAGGVALTGDLSTPSCVTAGCIANGWTCQEPGGTGGACSAYVICSRLQ